MIFALEDYKHELAPVLPFACFIILLGRMMKKSKGQKYLFIYFLRSVFLLVIYYAFEPLVLCSTRFMCMLMYRYWGLIPQLLHGIFIGVLLYQLLLRIESRGLIARSLLQTILWAVIMGMGTYFTEYLYSMLTDMVDGNGSSLRLMASVLIPINLGFEIATGIVVYYLFSKRHKS